MGNADKIGTALGILGAVWKIYNDIERDLLKNVRCFMAQNVEPIISAFDEKIKI